MTPRQARKEAEKFVHACATAASEPPVRVQPVVRRRVNKCKGCGCEIHPSCNYCGECLCEEDEL